MSSDMTLEVGDSMLRTKILVVDHSKEYCDALVDMLGHEFELFCAYNREEALMYLDKSCQMFQLVLLDINSVEVDGFWLLQYIKEQEWLREIPVMVMSERTSSQTIDGCFKMGALDFLIKPFSRSIVTNRIRNVISLNSGAFKDPLTGGYNRKGFIRMTEHILADCADRTDYAIVFIDIKNFKAVNELFDIRGGDSLLCYCYEKLVDSPLAPIFTSRIQADHFVCLVEKKNLDFEYLTSQKEKYIYNGKTIHLHFNCGIYFIENTGISVSGMIDRAKLAKEYIIDKYIKPYAVYDQAMRITYVDKARFVSEFDDSITNEEIKVYYQPVMNAFTGKLVSAEALVRWNHPEKGFISPAVFIPTLEKDGYISKLDRYVIDRVCELITERYRAGLPLVPVSVNLSWMDFYDEALMEHIIRKLESSEFLAEVLRFEITETSYAALEENRSVVLEKLRALGSKILLDDFGTGYSSFGMLKDYNFDILKIDMEFTKQIEVNTKVKSIIRAIIHMCHQMGIQVIAEGAETLEQVLFLRDHGCDYTQGYYFSAPMQEEAFLAMLDDLGGEAGRAEHVKKDLVNSKHRWLSAGSGRETEDAEIQGYTTVDLKMKENARRIVFHQIMDMNAAKNMESAIEHMLEVIGQFMKADRAYVFEQEGTGYSNTYEWCAPGVTAEKMNLQKIPADELTLWTEPLSKDECVVIPNVSDIKYSSPVIYNYLEPQSITSVIEAPIMYDGVLRGFIGVDNAPQEKVSMISDSLQSLGIALAVAFSKRDEHQKVMHRADYDELTDLMKKNVAKAKIEQILDVYPEGKHVMLFIDLDDFKSINDNWGHCAGDYALKCVSRVMQQEFRGKDILARFGGDEFIVFLEHVNSVQAVQMRAAGILEKLHDCTMERYQQIHLSGSIGIAFSDKNDTAEDMLRKSDEALYKAKQKGKNQYYIYGS